ncbi:MAG: exodeoxyribonuclease V subunit gamma [Reinekea sp.]
MLYTYPSNRLENLVFALDTLLNQLERPVLETDQILVQHPGMQHWLSMELAKLNRQQICMNIKYPLPVRYFWDLIRLILGPESIPERSVYSREILVWRIHILLAEPQFSHHQLTVAPTRYWQAQPEHLQDRRRFQLAEQLADLFEQYLMFRPQWIEQWEAGDTPHWQALLWQQLVKEEPNHPLRLMTEAVKHIEHPAKPLPTQFFIFGINALAPVWLDFLSALSNSTETDIHLLYLNPSAEQWDDLRSEKQQIKLQVQQSRQRAQWVSDDEFADDAGNPLLTSFGHQGQAFVRLLSDRADHDTQVFSRSEQSTLLARLQNDILTLNDRRKEPETNFPNDGSIQFTSAHSAFREVQGLHDWLLHQFNNDPSLTPKDVLVMCPNVEDYAPFVQAVFARSFADMADDIPPLPCSIADRNLKNADPTVAAFLELLTLPDARFEVNQIIRWLRVPAIADKFGLSTTDLKKIERWLLRANVHWGFSAQHKQQWLPENNATDHFTWKQGLDRLLLGFAFADKDRFINDQFLLHDAEGEDAILLGRLTHLIEQLHDIRSHLNRTRTPAQWQSFLQEQLKLAMFSTENQFERSHQAIQKAIDDLTEFANKAGLYKTDIPLRVIRHALDNAFASPEQTGSQFMTGQITVCSMVPMRSIPFRIIAVLGLNDGQFPRTRPPLGFDLMAQEKPKLGDRSRRGDDRYLFLEAILSARDALYLSFQGADIRKNEARPASLVLEELIDYLKNSYGFDRDKDIRQLPLQPFSERNYRGDFPSFEAHWQRLSQVNAVESVSQLKPLPEQDRHFELTDWINFFTHPSRYFAQRRLGLYHDQWREDLSDSEPFALTHLNRYQVQQQHIAAILDNSVDDFQFHQAMAASELPLSELTSAQINNWKADANLFAQVIQNAGANTQPWQNQTLTLHQCQLTASLPVQHQQRQILWRLANLKGKDLIQLWLAHLCANANRPTSSVGFYRGKNDQIERVTLAPIDNARQTLNQLSELFLCGQTEPMFLNAELVLNAVQQKTDLTSYQKTWSNDWEQQGLAYDPYIQYFWSELPDYEYTMGLIEALYEPLIKQIEFTLLDGTE